MVVSLGIWYYRKRQKANQKSLQNDLHNTLDRLEDILLEEDMLVVSAMCKEIKNQSIEANEMAGAFCTIFESKGAAMRLLKKMIDDEIAESDSSDTLFRNSVAGRTMGAYSKLIGLNYLKAVLRDPVLKVCENARVLEVDPRKLSEGDNLDENWDRLKEASQEFLDAITDSVDKCPMEFRELCHYMLTQIETKFPDMDNATALSYVGRFILLRCLIPALTCPERYDIIKNPPSMKARGALIRIGSGLQCLALGIQVGERDVHMIPMNEFIIRNRHGFKKFLEAIAQVPAEIEPTIIDIPEIEKIDALSSVHRLVFANQQPIVAWLEREQGDDGSEEKAEKLLKVVDDSDQVCLLGPKIVQISLFKSVDLAANQVLFRSCF